MNFRCHECDAPFDAPLRHRTLGFCCPVCLVQIGQPSPRWKPSGRPLAQEANKVNNTAVRVTVKDRIVEYQSDCGLVKCARCAFLFKFAVRDSVWGLCCPGCLGPLTRSTKKKYRRASRAIEIKPVLPPLFEDFDRADPGNPLGVGMPSGSTLREDGESHREAWKRLLRFDPCAYCGGPSGTVDHIEPQSRAARGIGGRHSWLNYIAACEGCNTSKSAQPLLEYLGRRAGVRFSWKPNTGRLAA